MSETCLAAQGLTKKFFRKGREAAQWFDAVAGVDLELASGEFVVLMGRSGGGKSTLLNMLGGLLEPSEGTVALSGSDLYALSDDERSRVRNERIGVVPQGQTPLHSLTAVQNVTLPYLMYRADDGVEARALELLESLGIRQLADSYPSELSGGEMRRMAIARALICNPSVVLADEPTSDLDDENTQVVLQKLRDVANAGAAVLVATHDAAAIPFADRVLRIDGGHLTQ
jgi:putative ABC transport system ATP-binding protein